MARELLYIKCMKSRKYSHRLGSRRRNLAIFLSAAVIMFIIATTTWAAISIIQPDDTTAITDSTNTSDVISELTPATRSRAPEPATLALFGSGVFGMLVGFVRRVYITLKRAFDITSSIVGLIILSPLLLCAAIFIKLVSRGPILYKQVRVGKDGELFEIFKFRTMRVDAEKETGPVWAGANDRRLILGGRFIRKAHLDELPQLINILKGDMSLIGPRPERPFFVEKFKAEISDYEKRLAVKPGLTGLAQVWHRYDETLSDVRKKIKYDLLYIKKLCLWTDFLILLRTIRVVFTGEGAR